MSRRAVIDIGANTVKLTVFDILRKNGKIKLDRVAFSTATLSLGSRRKNGKIEKDAERELINTLKLYIKTSKRNGCDDIRAFATASLRGAEDSDELLQRIKTETGLYIDILPGEKEAEYCFRALKYAAGEDITGCTADMGGGSVEISVFEKGEISETVSLEIGCLYLYRKFVTDIFPSEYEADKIYEYVMKELKNNIKTDDCGYIWLSGGTCKAIAKISAAMTGREYDRDTPYDLTIPDFNDVINFLIQPQDGKEEYLKSIVPARVKTTVPGAIAIRAIVDFFSPGGITVIDTGIREGYILSTEDVR